ncbi:cell division protein SepF [Trueperella pecoris]|uniref:cell division protein SepF n=1 Tax=Trueperella pecoris TaxID=2733571 RepID=UPI001ABE19E0|nr:cell division protein SepF [Trueperella pecoris]QTG76194.1 cell division protein SepF [Trueperella pecoris]
MGIFDRITAKAMPYEDDYYDEDVVDYGEYDETGEEYPESEAPVSSIRPVSQAPEVARIVTVWVANYKEVRDFAVEFRNGLPVVLNLSHADDAERTRIVDFAVGLCFGLEGDFNRISDDVFLLTPKSVKIDSHGSEAPHTFA